MYCMNFSKHFSAVIGKQWIASLHKPEPSLSVFLLPCTYMFAYQGLGSTLSHEVFFFFLHKRWLVFTASSFHRLILAFRHFGIQRSFFILCCSILFLFLSNLQCFKLYNSLKNCYFLQILLGFTQLDTSSTGSSLYWVLYEAAIWK